MISPPVGWQILLSYPMIPSRPNFSIPLPLLSSNEVGCFFKYRIREKKRRPRLVFLCGGNSDLSEGELSYRRKAVYDFLLRSNEYYPVIAEDVFKFFEHKSKNPLDLEKEICKIADKIVIILESQSAFVEFGAFSSDEFRKKLVIINDKNYKDAPSFVNVGPIRKLEEIGKEKVILYPFRTTSKDLSCPIAEAFPRLISALNTADKTAKSHSKMSINPPQGSIEVNSLSIMLLHDIISLFGPISHRMIIAIFERIYGLETDLDDLTMIEGLLVSMKMVKASKPDSGSETIFTSILTENFYHYAPSLFKVSARIKLAQRVHQ